MKLTITLTAEIGRQLDTDELKALYSSLKKELESFIPVKANSASVYHQTDTARRLPTRSSAIWCDHPLGSCTGHLVRPNELRGWSQAHEVYVDKDGYWVAICDRQHIMVADENGRML